MNSDIAMLFNSKPCSDIKKILNYCPVQWLADRPQPVVDFFSKLCGLNPKSKEQAYQVAKVIEQIYCAKNSRLILPLSFRHNLISYSLSGSKQLIKLNSKISPAGSYTFLKNWFNDNAREEISFPSGTVRVVFDNEQVVGKRYTVSLDNPTVPLSVVTSHAYLELDKNSNTQSREELSPKHWLFQNPNEMSQKLANFPAEFSEDFRSSRNQFIQTRLDCIEQRQKLIISENGAKCFTDYIDHYVNQFEESKSEKTCSECGAENDFAYRLCTNCKGKLKKKVVNIQCLNSDSHYDPYKHFHISFKKNDVVVKVGEPDSVNPNSFANISLILRNLGRRAGIRKYDSTKTRQWIFLENDGGIYTILSKLIANVLKCNICEESFYGKSNFENHSCFVLHNASYEFEFDWIVALPGLLHLEMNAAKAFLSLNWDIFMESVMKDLGITSEVALMYARKGSDHHKLWQILEIVYLALSDELLLPFIRSCLKEGITVSVSNYWKYCENIKSGTYAYFQQMTFTYLHSLMLLRTGVRHNNSKAILTAESKLVDLFFVRNHPIYREIFYEFFKIECFIPPEIKEIMHDTLAVSRTGHENHYQGGDAVLEEINKAAKRWSIGVPSFSQWQRNFRNLDDITKVRFCMFFFILLNS